MSELTLLFEKCYPPLLHFNVVANENVGSLMLIKNAGKRYKCYFKCIVMRYTFQ